jgi:hypothetical protein
MSNTHGAAAADPNAGKPADANAAAAVAADPNAGKAADPNVITDPNANAAANGTGVTDPNAGKAADPNAKTVDQFWRDQVAPEFKAQADRFASLNDVFKSNNDLRTDNSNRIKVPGADASDEDKAKYRKALGIPDKPDGYKIEPPEGIELTEADNELLKVVMPIAHEEGVPEKAFNGFVSKFLQLSRDMQVQAIDSIKQFGEAAETQLKKEWGRDFDTNLTLANRVADFIGPDFKKLLNETPIVNGGMLGDHPVIVKALAQLGRGMDESTISISATPEQKASVQEQIDALNKAVPVGSPQYTSKDHQAKLQDLFAKLHGSTPIVGSSGRAA